MTEPAGAGAALPRAWLHVGGLTVARQQLGLALALGCERIVCLARALVPELVGLQHVAEAAGAQFHAVSAPRALSGLVTAADELIVLTDGLLADPAEAARLLDGGIGVLVQPVEAGLAAGFERIDLNHASAGAMRVPGGLVERLADLPGDVDASAALLRIALQSGVPQRPIGGPDGTPRWTLVRDDDQAHAIEADWLRRLLPDERPAAIGPWLARFAAQRLGPALLHGAGGPRTLVWSALALAVFALGAGWLGLAWLGLLLAAIGWIVRQTAEQLQQVERKALLLPLPRWPDSALYGWMFDLLLVVLAGWSATVHAGRPQAEVFFAPAMLVALVRLVPRALRARWTDWLEDRALLALGLMAAALAGEAGMVHHIAAAGLALAGTVLPRGNRG
ncbi:MAG: hypothetical protein ACREBO_10840 [Novosphingobium sp.]